jgi:hypothetical protein
MLNLFFLFYFILVKLDSRIEIVLMGSSIGLWTTSHKVKVTNSNPSFLLSLCRHVKKRFSNKNQMVI